ncbi:hypothetical protein [Mesorhizobium sp. A556]
MPTVKTRVPDGWGKDTLSSFIDEFRHNQFATFSRKREAMTGLERIDELLKRFLYGAVDPKPFVPMSFLTRAHSAFRATSGVVMGGHLYESQALMRLSLEHAAYGLYIGDDGERWTRWMQRHDSDEAEAAVRKEFSHNRIRKHVQSIDSNLGERFDLFYGSTIDFGAHPNELGFSANTLTRKDDDGGVAIMTVYLQGDGKLLDLALKMTAHVGLWVLDVAEHIYGERFATRGFSADLVEAKKGY